MSCGQCDLHKGVFKTENDFSNFENLIANLVQSGKLVDLGRNYNARFFEVRYRCSLCNAIWSLSFPDQAHRGRWYEE